MSSMSIPLFKIYWDDSDVKAVDNVIKRGSSWACGSEIEKFETAVSRYLGTRYCVAFNSGTSALHASLLAHGIKEGDEVIVPSFTFIATANAPLFVGARPVFADIEEGTLGLNPNDVANKISKKTKAIIPVHYSGCPCKINELRKIADDHDIVLIEDAAEAMGAKTGNKMVGGFGDSSILSFCQNKIITTGEGGAVVTSDKKLYDKMALLRSHGRPEGNYFSTGAPADYVAMGYNFRFPTMLAALGISQLNKIERIIGMRARAAEHYKKKMSGMPGISVPDAPRGCRHVYQMFTIRVEGGRNARDGLMSQLKKNGIASKVYFEPVHMTTFYRKMPGCRKGSLPVTERLSDEVLSLPMHPTLSEKDIDYIAEKIRAFLTI